MHEHFPRPLKEARILFFMNSYNCFSLIIARHWQFFVGAQVPFYLETAFGIRILHRKRSSATSTYLKPFQCLNSYALAKNLNHLCVAFHVCGVCLKTTWWFHGFARVSFLTTEKCLISNFISKLSTLVESPTAGILLKGIFKFSTS